MAVLTDRFESKRDPSREPYITTLDTETGEAFCDCNGFIYCKSVPRICTHIRTLQERAKSETGAGQGQVEKSSPAVAGTRIRPMLANSMPDGRSLADYSSVDWRMEEKIDGERMIVRVDRESGTVSAWSRPRAGKEPIEKKLTTKLQSALLDVPSGIYDGELFVPGGTSSDVRKRENADKLRIVLFDVLEVMGSDVTDLPLHERRQILELSVSHHTVQRDASALISFLEWQDVTHEAVSAIWNRGGEGAILKNIHSVYRSGFRSNEWVKVKREGNLCMRVTGYKAGKCGPYSVIKVAGHGIESEVKAPPVVRKEIEKDPSAKINAEVAIEFTEYTPDGKLRHPRFDHWVTVR